MDGAVSDRRGRVAASIGTIESDGGLECVFLRAVVNLHVVHDKVTFAHSAVTLHKIGCHDLTTPSVCIFTINLDVTGEHENFSTDVNSVVKSTSGLGSTVMVVP